jgi:hypothetical protein
MADNSGVDDEKRVSQDQCPMPARILAR